MTIYFVNVRDTKSGYLMDEFCATFDPAEYGSEEAAKAAAEECYEGSVELMAPDGYEVMFLAFS